MPEYKLNGNYMDNLLSKMNEPDPRDVNYLNKGLKEHETSVKVVENARCESVRA